MIRFFLRFWANPQRLTFCFFMCSHDVSCFFPNGSRSLAPAKPRFVLLYFVFSPQKCLSLWASWTAEGPNQFENGGFNDEILPAQKPPSKPKSNLEHCLKHDNPPKKHVRNHTKPPKKSNAINKILQHHYKKALENK